MLFSLLVAAPAALALEPPPMPPRALGAAVRDAVPAPAARLRPAAGPSSLGGLADVQVNADPGNLVDEAGPAVAVSPSGVIQIVWTGDETQKTVWTARSTDGGATFSTPVRVNDAVPYPPSYSVFQPDIAVGPNGTVYVVWFDYRAWASDFDYGSPIDVYLDRSLDGGVTWSTDVLASVGGSGTYPWHFQPYIAVDRATGALYVAFNDLDRFGLGDGGDVSLARSLDGGATFQAKRRVDDLPDTSHVTQKWPAIAVGPAGDVDVAFEDSRGSSTDIRLVRSADHGLTFGPSVRVNADTTGLQVSPSLAVTPAGQVCAAWVDWSTDTDPTTAPFVNNVLFARSPAGGAAFGAPVTVNDAPMNADYGFDWPPRLAADAAGIVHATWFDRRVDTTLCYYDRSIDGGVTFGSDVVVSQNRDRVSHALPRIAMGGNDNPCITWVDRRNGNAHFDVFYAGRRPVTDVPIASANDGALRASPNPFTRATSVSFALPRSARVHIDVRDLQGRLLRRLSDGARAPGRYTVSWDGRDASGRPAPVGVYFVSLEAGGAASRVRAVRIE
jgi:hypothetical protein